jgi:hypothetical protein
VPSGADGAAAGGIPARTSAPSVEGLFALQAVRAVCVLACPLPPSRTCVSGMTVPLAGQSRPPLGSNSPVDPKGGVALSRLFPRTPSRTPTPKRHPAPARPTVYDIRLVHPSFRPGVIVGARPSLRSGWVKHSQQMTSFDHVITTAMAARSRRSRSTSSSLHKEGRSPINPIRSLRRAPTPCGRRARRSLISRWDGRYCGADCPGTKRRRRESSPIVRQALLRVSSL